MIQDEVYFDAMDKMKKEFLKYKDLPFAVYINSKEGVFLDFNQEAGKLLELQESNKGKLNIRTLYVNEKERNRLEKKYIDNKEADGWLREETLFLKVGIKQTRKHFKYCSLPFFKNDDKKEGKWVGSLCMLLETSALERFSDFKEDIPAGIFEVSFIEGEPCLVYYDKKISDLFGLPYPVNNSIPAKDFLVNRKGVPQIIEKIIAAEGGRLKDEPVRLKSPIHSNKPPMLVNMDIKGEFHEKDGEKILIKAQGILNEHGIILDFLNKAPLGLYIVMEDQDGDEIITWANDNFGKITGHEKGVDCIGENILAPCYHTSEEDYKLFKEALKDSFLQGQPLSDHFIEVVNNKNELKQIFVYANGIPKKEGDRNELMLGRVGASMDISYKAKRHLHDDFYNDFGAFLHLFLALLQDFNTSLNSIIEGHDTESVIDGVTNLPDAYGKLLLNFNEFDVKLDTLFERCIQKKILPESYVNRVQKLKNDWLRNVGVSQFRFENDYRVRAAAFRRFSIKVRDDLKENKRIKSELTSDWEGLHWSIVQILRYARLITLSQVAKQIDYMFLDIDMVTRAILNAPVQQTDLKAVVFRPLLDQVMADLTEYANSMKVEVRIHYLSKVNELVTSGIYRNIYVAVFNVLHNAIKYSFNDETDFKIPVSINVSRDELKNCICLSIENIGVAIEKKEIPYLFKFSYRGLHHGDRQRPGSGVGLWHTYKILTEHGGTIEVTSTPINKNTEDYSRPFNNKFKLYFPAKTL